MSTVSPDITLVRCHVERPARADEVIAAFNVRAENKGWPMRFERARGFQHAPLTDLLNAWHARAGKGTPRRSDFDARTLKPVLPTLSIVERVSLNGKNRHRVRLVGTALTPLFGEHTGRFIDEALPPAFVERWAASYDTILDAGCPIRIETVFELPQVSYLEAETFSAPVRGASGETDTVLSATCLRAKESTPRH